MNFELWEVGIVLIGIGFLILSIVLSMTISNVKSTLKKVDYLVDDNIRDISDIIRNAAGITGSVDTIADGGSRIVGLISGASLLSGKKRKRRVSRRDY